MFETIAMICYLSISEPQNFEAPAFEETPIVHVFTGGGGGDPGDNPNKEKEN
ncbi:hypothetical protein [Kangiella sp.]|uniref:hypothetical protein n=1 Tax=Kangiella sp. TaxID=1920245 RepID=UPI00198584B0|nr:hypothetical protein [Kangiella sp.]MBD3652416.1 hypothetical protein [Kangiella sp.]